MTTTTDTGFARANEVYGDSIRIFYFPFDFSWVMQKAFANIQPSPVPFDGTGGLAEFRPDRTSVQIARRCRQRQNQR